MENWAPKHYEARQADITNRMKFWPSRSTLQNASRSVALLALSSFITWVTAEGAALYLSDTAADALT